MEGRGNVVIDRRVFCLGLAGRFWILCGCFLGSF